MGEKFTTNPVNGTAAFEIPLPLPTGRSEFGPKLSLSYDSGAGNSPFGLGWRLSVPSITRKTDKGLPRYDDQNESDVFILTGAEDLVPELRRVSQEVFSAWDENRSVGGVEYRVRRYRPRTEGLFARIERWVRVTDGDTHWRTISRDNVTTLFGLPTSSTVAARVADPEAPWRVFSWLASLSYDDRGNVAAYEYLADDSVGVDVGSAEEGNRPPVARTANRYLKRVRYANTTSVTAAGPVSPLGPDLSGMGWHFEVVLDYGEGHLVKEDDTASGEVVRATVSGTRPWPVRPDAFSNHRAGFEVRTYRRCERVLLFHHFAELSTQACLVRSLDFGYLATPITSYLQSVTASGYVQQPDEGYLRRTTPPIELTYSRSPLEEFDGDALSLQDLDPISAENAPSGTAGDTAMWVDLDGEGVSGLLAEQGDGWYYKANLGGRLGPSQQVSPQPVAVELTRGRQRFLDINGDGRVEAVDVEGSPVGYYSRSADDRWEPFRSFRQAPRVDWGDPNLRLVDLTGDGLADVLVAEGDRLTWFGSLGTDGFDAGVTLRLPADEDRGPRVLFSDSEQAVFLADMSGDGLSDLVRVAPGEVAYWPNLGYGRFGRKVTMGNSPWFEARDQFHPQRVHLADTDGSGTADLLYHGRYGVDVYLNHAGNGWSTRRRLGSFPPSHQSGSLDAVDLLGAGTVCLVWSTALPGEARRPVKYMDLMNGQKPHLLVRVENNLGAETLITYAPSTRFHLADKAAGRPWATRLPFPVHVVARVDTLDRISRSRFVTRYTYHHGHYDGIEREFRGFGLVEQSDTEEFGVLQEDTRFPSGGNVEAASHVPPVLTRTWFHTGHYADVDRLSAVFAGEYYRDGSVPLLEDTVLPPGLTVQEEREACRALRGQMLRQEVYALDGSETPDHPFGHPYQVTEQNFTLRRIQPPAGNRYAVFFTHPREAITFHYERKADQPRVTHTLTLEVDDFGNVLKSVTAGYRRIKPIPSVPPIPPADQVAQKTSLLLYTETTFTNPVVATDTHRAPLVAEQRTFELTGYDPGQQWRPLQFSDLVRAGTGGLELVFDSEITFEARSTNGKQRRLVEHTRTLYRRDNFSGALGLGRLESLAVPFESYKRALTPGLLTASFDGRVSDAILSEGGYRKFAGDDGWWIPSGRVLFSPTRGHTDAEELHHARTHYFLPGRYRDPFHSEEVSTETVVRHDAYALLVLEVEDPLGNRVTAGIRDDLPIPTITDRKLDYRVLQPTLVMDPNRNCAAVAYDALGMAVGSAVMGKPGDRVGDSLDGFVADLPFAVAEAHIGNPAGQPHDILKKATTRTVYDLFAYRRTKSEAFPSPPVVYTLVRETHQSDLGPGQQTAVQHAFGYSDGFGREIQRKIQAEPGPAFKSEPASQRTHAADRPKQALSGMIGGVARVPPVVNADPRWVGTGWTVFDNKGNPVRRFEPFFTDTHRFEFDARIGVSDVLFYDPPGRVVATLHANHTWEKVVYGAWGQDRWDANDTVTIADPTKDADVGPYFRRLPAADYTPTWYDQRKDGGLGPAERDAAQKAAVHAGTHTTVHFDPLGRPVSTVVRNRRQLSGDANPSPVETLRTATALDIEGQIRSVVDAKDRVVAKYDYDMAGNRLTVASMEAGTRWTLVDVLGKPINTWDSRDHRVRTTYDALRRVTGVYLRTGKGQEVLVEKYIYGEGERNPEANNLRTRVVTVSDQAGTLVTKDFDFKGNRLKSTRKVATEYKKYLNWLQPVSFEPEEYTEAIRFDAINRPTQTTAPDGSVIRNSYNVANLLERVESTLAGETTTTVFVANIDYDALGRRTRIDYGNGASTTYTYDPLTQRLTNLVTKRDATKFPDDCRQPPPAGWPGCWLQDLKYAYDPVGNITSVRDSAQQSIFFQNKRVDPEAWYTYDAAYRLVEATGREHLGQGGQLLEADPFGYNHTQIPHPGDGQAMGTFRETYDYDPVGNFVKFTHRGGKPAVNFTRDYAYLEPSQLEPGVKSNRLTQTKVGGDVYVYKYNAHGDMTEMSHLPEMGWDYKDQLYQTKRTLALNQGCETTYYVYDFQGQRVRKVTERNVGSRRNERLYLNAYEVYREYAVDGATVTLDRSTLHVSNGSQRVALIERRIQGTEGEARLIRFQLDNHLGTASIELDHEAKVISYEEYFPYGATSYQATRGGLDRNPKRYRYTGKERDEESGLYYYGARYYSPWLALQRS